MTSLDDLDLSLKLSKKQQAERLQEAQDHLVALRLQLGGLTGDGELGPGLLCVFEGWDASGKGGAIERLIDGLDARHVRVKSFSAPTHDEKRHHYMGRFWPSLPGLGGMAVFDRSWYGRVLVERVEGYASVEQWSRAYEEINEFERSLAAEGTIIVKFWLHVSEEEQLKRFEKREKDPLKGWKLTDEDWRNREKRPQYEEAIEEMLERTSTEWAPWTLVEGDSKKWARVKVVESVVAAVEEGMRARNIQPLKLEGKSAVLAARGLLRARPGPRALLGPLALAPALACSGALDGRVAEHARQRAPRVSRDPHADRGEGDQQRAADREQRRAPDVAAEPARAGRCGGRRRRGRGGRQRPERAALRARRSGGCQQRGDEDQGGEAAHRSARRYYAGAPVRAHRLPRKRAPQVSRRTAISAARPAQTPRMPQPW